MDATDEALNMLAQGKRNMLCQEVPTAVQQFQEACQKLSTSYGELAKECADAYYYYGVGLLELSRMESGVLGNALQGVDDADENADEPDDKEKEQFEPTDKLTGKSSAGEADQDKEKEGKDGQEKEGEDGEAEGEEEEGEDAEEDGETGEGEAAEGEEEGGDEENKDGEDPDDVPNLQLAWEMLELSKVIYLKAESKESKLKAAQSYLKLGEVSMETESYEQAVEDIKTCLKIQEENLDPDDRLIAETHYHLGLAYQFNKQFENAIDHFRAAVKCLESKIEHLKKVVEEKPPQDPSEFIDPAQKAAEEIKEIEKILPDIRDKIEDAQEELRGVDNLKLMTKEAMGQVFSSLDSATETGFTSTSKSSASPTKSADDKKTSDISHLIRKKRKPEDEASAEDLDNKKPRQEGATGDAESKPVAKQNGHVEKPEDKPVETAEPMATG